MAKRKAPRKSWQDSWALMKLRGVPLPPDGHPPPQECDRPRAGEADFRGLTVRGRHFEEVDFEDLSLPRTLFAGCRFHGVSFRNTDLLLSCLHGCEWIDCDFSGADLIRADLRAGTFFACRFTGAVLIGADLRGATLDGCVFTRAALTGTCIDHALKGTLRLSATQRDFMVDWRREGDEGPDEESDEDE